MQPCRDPKPTLQNRQGFHRTSTIDYVYVRSGEVVLLLDDQEVLLRAGDTAIQRNTDHGWRVDVRRQHVCLSRWCACDTDA